MLVVREILQCEPGKVRPMIEKFKGINAILERLGHRPFRLLSDVSGPDFWTVVAETEVESFDAFVEMQNRVMADSDAGEVMSGYHDLIQNGRREIYRLES